MAQNLDLSDTAPQALQQFITSSPWDWGPARVELARIAAELIPDAVWTAKPVLLRKRGSHSVGLRPGVLPGTGRRVNCQVGIGLFLSGPGSSIPVAWRLLLDDTWCGDPERRRRARIPDGVRPRPAWALVLEMTEELAAAGVAESVPWCWAATSPRTRTRWQPISPAGAGTSSSRCRRGSRSPGRRPTAPARPRPSPPPATRRAWWRPAAAGRPPRCPAARRRCRPWCACCRRAGPRPPCTRPTGSWRRSPPHRDGPPGTGSPRSVTNRPVSGPSRGAPR
ncbi:transposase [Streptomyces zhihengii]